MNKQENRVLFKENAIAFIKKQGFFIVLGLCVICIGIAAVITIPRNTAEQAVPTPAEQEVGQSQDQSLQEVVNVTPTPQITPSAAPAIAPAATASPTPAPKTERPKTSAKNVPPVDGKVVWGFAVDTLLYSKTLELWTTHEGIDLAAKQGTEVRAIKSGTVSEVYKDDALGITVIVEHSGSLTSIYANLADAPRVEKGQAIETGAIIGEVGNTAVSECGLESHLHFEIHKKGKPVDPSEYVLLEQK